MGWLLRVALLKECQISLKKRKLHWKKCNLEFRKCRIKDCEWSKIPEKCAIKDCKWWLWFRKCGIKECEFWTKFAFFNSHFCSAGLFPHYFLPLRYDTEWLSHHPSLSTLTSEVLSRSKMKRWNGELYVYIFLSALIL